MSIKNHPNYFNSYKLSFPYIKCHVFNLLYFQLRLESHFKDHILYYREKKHAYIAFEIVWSHNCWVFLEHLMLQLGNHFRNGHQRCSMQKGVLRNLTKFTGKHLCQSLFFYNVVGQAWNFIKKRLWHRCFPVNFVTFLRTTFLQNTSGGCFCHLLSIIQYCNFSHDFTLFMEI